MKELNIFTRIKNKIQNRIEVINLSKTTDDRSKKAKRSKVGSSRNDFRQRKNNTNFSKINAKSSKNKTARSNNLRIEKNDVNNGMFYSI